MSDARFALALKVSRNAGATVRRCGAALAAVAGLSAAGASVAGPIELNPPGLPLSAAPDVDGKTEVINEGGGVGVQPIVVLGQSVSTTPGDVVILNDPLGSNESSNFDAVVAFFNPADPSGALGLPATEYQTYFGGNVGPTTFANLVLAPNTIFVPQSSGAPTPGAAVADYFVYGPQGAIAAGQLAIFVLTAVSQPAIADPEPPVASSAPEPAAWAMLLLGVGLIGGALRRLCAGLAAEAAGAAGA